MWPAGRSRLGGATTVSDSIDRAAACLPACRHTRMPIPSHTRNQPSYHNKQDENLYPNATAPTALHKPNNPTASSSSGGATGGMTPGTGAKAAARKALGLLGSANKQGGNSGLLEDQARIKEQKGLGKDGWVRGCSHKAEVSRPYTAADTYMRCTRTRPYCTPATLWLHPLYTHTNRWCFSPTYLGRRRPQPPPPGPGVPWARSPTASHRPRHRRPTSSSRPSNHRRPPGRASRRRRRRAVASALMGTRRRNWRLRVRSWCRRRRWRTCPPSRTTTRRCVIRHVSLGGGWGMYRIGKNRVW